MIPYRFDHKDSCKHRLYEFGDSVLIFDMDYEMSQFADLAEFVLRNYRKFYIIPSSPHSYSLGGIEDFIQRAIRLDAEITIFVLNIFMDPKVMNLYSEWLTSVINVPPTIDVRIIDDFETPILLTCGQRDLVKLDVYKKKGNLAVLQAAFYEIPETFNTDTDELDTLYASVFLYSGLSTEFHDVLENVSIEDISTAKIADLIVFDYRDRDAYLLVSNISKGV